jgi:hypothetical protein
MSLIDQANKTEVHQSIERPRESAQWTKPDAGWVKVNMDAAIDKTKGMMGFGIILRDHDGRLVAAKSMVKMGVWDPIATETLVVFLGVKFC